MGGRENAEPMVVSTAQTCECALYQTVYVIAVPSISSPWLNPQIDLFYVPIDLPSHASLKNSIPIRNPRILVPSDPSRSLMKSLASERKNRMTKKKKNREKPQPWGRWNDMRCDRPHRLVATYLLQQPTSELMCDVKRGANLTLNVGSDKVHY